MGAGAELVTLMGVIDQRDRPLVAVPSAAGRLLAPKHAHQMVTNWHQRLPVGLNSPGAWFSATCAVKGCATIIVGGNLHRARAVGTGHFASLPHKDGCHSD